MARAREAQHCVEWQAGHLGFLVLFSGESMGCQRRRPPSQIDHRANHPGRVAEVVTRNDTSPRKHGSIAGAVAAQAEAHLVGGRAAIEVRAQASQHETKVVGMYSAAPERTAVRRIDPRKAKACLPLWRVVHHIETRIQIPDAKCRVLDRNRPTTFFRSSIRHCSQSPARPTLKCARFSLKIGGTGSALWDFLTCSPAFKPFKSCLFGMERRMTGHEPCPRPPSRRDQNIACGIWGVRSGASVRAGRARPVPGVPSQGSLREA